MIASTTKRSRTGNTLLLIVAVSFLIVAVALIFICLYLVMNQQKRNESKAEELALSMAIEINHNDWVADLNELTGFSRELVFTSRESLNTVASDYPQLKPLALQLLDESRRSAQIVEAEKKTYLANVVQNMKANISKANDASKGKVEFSMPWFTTGPAEIQSVDLGYLEGIPSNVGAPIAIQSLKDFDVAHEYLNEKSGFYNANVNAKLPQPDDDLNFTISSLPPTIKETISPARLASQDEFRKLLTVAVGQHVDISKCEVLPSAVQVHCEMQLSTEAANKKTEGRVKVLASAASSGATHRLEKH